MVKHKILMYALADARVLYRLLISLHIVILSFVIYEESNHTSLIITTYLLQWIMSPKMCIYSIPFG